MMRSDVVIYDDFLVIRRKKIMWDQIIGIRELNSPALRKISNRFPRAEFFLKEGKVVAISNLNKFHNESSFRSESEENTYETAMKIIRNKVTKLNPAFEYWLEWRLISPVLLLEVIGLIVSAVAGKTFEQTIITLILVGIVGIIPGWIWEKKRGGKN